MSCLNFCFSSHMVLPANKPLPLWGTGKGAAEINFGGHTLRTHCAADGTWSVEFPAMEYGGPYILTAIFEDCTVVLEDIYIGEVYLMAGQSNMQFKLRESSYPPTLWEGDPMVRLFTAPRPQEGESYTPADGWVLCTRETAAQWSALAYHVGQLRAREKGIAVGVIACYQGASVIESWVPEKAFEALGIALLPEQKYGDHFHEKYGRWNGDGFLYNTSLSTLFPFPLSAVVWYQGESDVSLPESEVYEAELAELIRIWRRDFKDEHLPFVVVQLADYIGRAGTPWHNIQQAQARISAHMDRVQTAVSADVCEKDNIHPPTKIKLAERIATALKTLL